MTIDPEKLSLELARQVRKSIEEFAPLVCEKYSLPHFDGFNLLCGTLIGVGIRAGFENKKLPRELISQTLEQATTLIEFAQAGHVPTLRPRSLEDQVIRIQLLKTRNILDADSFKLAPSLHATNAIEIINEILKYMDTA